MRCGGAAPYLSAPMPMPSLPKRWKTVYRRNFRRTSRSSRKTCVSIWKDAFNCEGLPDQTAAGPSPGPARGLRDGLPGDEADPRRCDADAAWAHGHGGHGGPATKFPGVRSADPHAVREMV